MADSPHHHLSTGLHSYVDAWYCTDQTPQHTCVRSLELWRRNTFFLARQASFLSLIESFLVLLCNSFFLLLIVTFLLLESACSSSSSQHATLTDWRYVTAKDDKFHNIFEHGQRTWGAMGHNINDKKIKPNQWGGTCVATMGQHSYFVNKTGINATGLG